MQQAADEAQFFVDEGMQDLIGRKQATCNSLVEKISEMYENHLKVVWAPATLELLDDKLDILKKADQALGLPQNVSRKMIVVAPACQKVLESALDSHIGEVTADILIPLQNEIMAVLSNACGSELKIDSGAFLVKPRLHRALTSILDSGASKVIQSVAHAVGNALREDQGDVRLGRFEPLVERFVHHFKIREGQTISALQRDLAAKMKVCVDQSFEPVLNLEGNCSNQHQRTVQRRGVTPTSSSNNATIQFSCKNPKSISDAAIFIMLEALHGLVVLDSSEIRQMCNEVQNWNENCSDERESIRLETAEVTSLKRKLIVTWAAIFFQQKGWPQRGKIQDLY